MVLVCLVSKTSARLFRMREHGPVVVSDERLPTITLR
jgi:hypothetical protein